MYLSYIKINTSLMEDKKMKKKTKIIIGMGILCILLNIVSTWYATVFNNSRLVVPMDFKSYTFQIKDLPMILSVLLTCTYIFALFLVLFTSISKQRKQIGKTNTTRKLNPKLGFLGIFRICWFLDLYNKWRYFSIYLFSIFWILWFFL